MTRQPTRYELAAKLLAAPVLDTPLLDRLRQNPADVNRWADVPWEALSAGERVVLGWLAREVWSGYPLLVPPDIRSSLWAACDQVRFDADSFAAVREVAAGLFVLTEELAA